MLDLVGSHEMALPLRDPAGQFTTVHDRLSEHPDPSIGYDMDTPDNAVVIKDYFRTFGISEVLAKHDPCLA